jgi:hypothetical protein
MRLGRRRAFRATLVVSTIDAMFTPVWLGSLTVSG